MTAALQYRNQYDNQYGYRDRKQYPAGMADDLTPTQTKFMGVEAARGVLGQVVDAAEQGEHTVLTKHGQPTALVVGIDWYRQVRAAAGVPTEL